MNAAPSFAAIPVSTEMIVKAVVDAALKVHQALGPGLLESVYEACLSYELTKRGNPHVRQSSVSITYDDLCIEAGLRLDILAADEVIVELKAVEEMTPLYVAQLLTYLKLTGKRVGLLINFISTLLKHGLKRMVV